MSVLARGGQNGKRTIRTIFCATKFQLYRSIKRTAQNCIENIEKKTQKLQNSAQNIENRIETHFRYKFRR